MSETRGNHRIRRAGQLLFAIAALLMLGLGLRLGTVRAAATPALLDLAAKAEAVSALPQAGTLVCNGQPVRFEDGIPSDWIVVNNSPAGIVWTTTADPACEIPNRTNGSGEAACADSDAAGTPSTRYDTELWTTLLDLTGWASVLLDVKAYYRDLDAGTNDRFEVDVWNGSAWSDELRWDESHEPEDFSLDLTAYVGAPEVRVRFRYVGNGFDYYAQVDEIELACTAPGPPVIEVAPAEQKESLRRYVVSTKPLTLTNSGGSPLNWNIVEDDSACDSPSDIPWLSVAPSAGATAPPGSTVVDVTFDSTGLVPGDYSANLCVNSDDPATPVVQVPVTLTVLSSGHLECNGDAITFEVGIPPGWEVKDWAGSGIVWTTTADPACRIRNRTNGSGEATCADSEAAGSPDGAYDTELWSNSFDLLAAGGAVLDLKAYYRDMYPGPADHFRVYVRSGADILNMLVWDEDHEPEDLSLDLSAFLGRPDVTVRFHYSGYGGGWYAQVDDIALRCAGPGPPVIGVDPAALSELLAPDLVSMQPLTLTNSGGSPLQWNIVEDDSACDSPDDIPWLSVAPSAGATAPLDGTVADVTFDSTGLAPGDYSAHLCVNSDDPATPLVQVPVTLTVLPPDHLECNGTTVTFEGGIPTAWAVVDNMFGFGIEWTTTADPACGIPNQTGSSGEAACADSEAAGSQAFPYDTELRTNPFDLSAAGGAVLEAKAYYRDKDHSTNDRLEVDVWNGAGWTNELSWDDDHEPEDLAVNLSAYAGLPEVRVRFRYRGDGFDWYAQVDDVALTCIPPSLQVIEVDPTTLTWSQPVNAVSVQPMTVINSGGSSLNWEVVEAGSSCDSPGDIPWLSIAPNSGATLPLGSTAVEVTFDSTGLALGDYGANLCVTSDDPATPLVHVPVALTVLPPDHLECNGRAIGFEGGIPPGWEVVDNTYGLGIRWTTTADPACGIPNRTGGSGGAACADSEAAGSQAFLYDTELRTNPFDLSAVAAAMLDVKAYYRDMNPGADDRFEVDVWGGSAWINELTWNEDRTPEDFTLDLAAYLGEPEVRVRFRYRGDGIDYYSQVDDIALTCAPSGPPIIEADPAMLAESGGTGVVSTRPMTLTNIGGTPLNWNIVEDDSACDSPSDIPWLSVAPNAGATLPLNSSIVDVTFDSTGLAPGGYTANLCINSDDPATPTVQVPVGLTVLRSCATDCTIYLPTVFRSVALTGQTPSGYVAASGPAIGRSIFPSETLARSMALKGQDWVDYMVANELKAPAAVP